MHVCVCVVVVVCRKGCSEYGDACQAWPCTSVLSALWAPALCAGSTPTTLLVRYSVLSIVLYSKLRIA